MATAKNTVKEDEKIITNQDPELVEEDEAIDDEVIEESEKSQPEPEKTPDANQAAPEAKKGKKKVKLKYRPHYVHYTSAGVISFDANGEYETDNDGIIERLLAQWATIV